MPEEQQHSNPEQKRYPEPEVPADQAWRSMKKLLETQLPETSAPLRGPGLNGFGTIRLLLVLVAGGTFLWWLLTMPGKPGNTSRAEQPVLQDTIQKVKQAATGNSGTTNGTSKENTNGATDDDTLLGTRGKNLVRDTAQNNTGEAKLSLEANMEENKISSVLTPGETGSEQDNTSTSVTKKMLQQKGPMNNPRNSIEKPGPRYEIHRKVRKGNETANLNETGSSVNTSVAAGPETDDRIKRIVRGKPAAYGDLKKVAAGNRPEKSAETNAPTEKAVAMVPDSFKRPTQAEGLDRKADLKFDGVLHNSSVVSGITAAILNNAPATVAAKVRKHMLHDNKFGWGVQWVVAIPPAGTKHYFTGTNGNSQPYTSLIPGAWASMDFGKKHQLLVQFMPYRIYFTGNPVIATGTAQVAGPYGPFVVKTTTYLNKTSSISGGLQYNYHFTTRWRIGAGLQYNRQRRALVHRQSVDSMGTVFSDSLIGLKQATSAPFLNASYSTGYGELLYGFKRFQLGGAVYVPLSTLSPAKPVRPFNSAVFLRWRFR